MQTALLALALFAGVNTFAAVNINKIDCSITPTDSAARFDRLVLTANDNTGEVKYQGYKNGSKSDGGALNSDAYVLYSPSDWNKDSKLKDLITQIAKSANIDSSTADEVVRFSMSGDNFFLLKYVAGNKELGSAMTIMGTVYKCQ